jgi:NTP pyrophosphatase (non-canonical NTP hydrolase)
MLNEYSEFVRQTTSKDSEHVDHFIRRVEKLRTDNPHINISLLLTGSMGLSAEIGEFNDVVKKLYFQGKTLDEPTYFHLKRELGDILWYWINTCRSLALDPDQVLKENIEKLQNRYEKGRFSVGESENRKKNDV